MQNDALMHREGLRVFKERALARLPAYVYLHQTHVLTPRNLDSLFTQTKLNVHYSQSVISDHRRSLLVESVPWTRPHRKGVSCGLLCSFYPGNSAFFNMVVTESDLDLKVRKMHIFNDCAP